MANYKESTLAGSSYVRCHTLMVYNPLDQQPVVHFQEETVVNMGGTVFKNQTEGIRLLVDPTSDIAVVDPETNLPTGEVVTHGRLYQLLYSAYLQSAMERDAV